jgi:hypothetical protein
VCATVVSGADAPPVFEAPEHVFNSVALFVEDGVMGDRGFPVGFRRNAGEDAALGESGLSALWFLVSSLQAKPAIF